MTERIIRDATVADAEACAKIYAPYVTDTVISFELEPPDAIEMADRIVADQREHAWLMLEEDGAPIGYAYGGPFRSRPAYSASAEVSVYLDRAHRGAGGGRMLYQALLARLTDRGFHAVFAGIALPNEASERLHRATGFTWVGTLHEVGWKHGAWRDVAWYQLVLPAPAAS